MRCRCVVSWRLSPRRYACNHFHISATLGTKHINTASRCRPVPDLGDGANELPWSPLRIITAFLLVRIALLFQKDVHELLAVATVHLARAGEIQLSESGSVARSYQYMAQHEGYVQCFTAHLM